MHSEAPRTQRTQTTGSSRGSSCLLLWLLLSLSLPLASGSPARAESFELSSNVRQSLLRLQAGWQRWVTGYYAKDQRGAETALEEILSIAEFLGMERLPDLSLAAGAYAVRSAREGEFERSAWALETARRLDPGRPEVHFAQAEVERAKGAWPKAILSLAQGYASLAALPRERAIWLHGAGLWGLYVLLAAGAFYLALLMFVRGRHLLDSLFVLLAPPLPPTLVSILLPILLLWPLVLPGGLLWAAFLWSVLLWRFLAGGQRMALAGVWILLGLVPHLMLAQSRLVEIELSRPARLLDRFAEGRLYGAMFQDLETLGALMPENRALDEVKADLYRQLRQWGHAQTQYERLNDAEPRNASVLVNLGLFFHEQKDYTSALRYFEQALERNPQLPEAHYNKAQALASIYDFEGSRPSLSRAQQLAPERVNEWIEKDLSGVAVDGGVRRIPEIREALFATLAARQDGGTARHWRRYATLALPLLLFLLGGMVDRFGTAKGLPRCPKPRHLHGLESTWVRTLVPGVRQVEAGRGVQALLAVLAPSALLLMPLAKGVGFRTPLGYDGGRWFVWGLTCVLLALWFGVRLVLERRA